MHRTRSRAIAFALTCLSTTASAQQIDVIRGRVTGPDSLPISGVTVRATSYVGNVSKSAKTDKNGRFAITYPTGEGDYWLQFSAIGYVPKRFEIKRIADEEILVADTRLTSNIATLDAVNISANAPRALPSRSGANPNVGGGERALSSANLPPDQMGNLAAMAAGIPGIQLIPGLDGAADMFSALGLSPDQNSTTVNGLGSGISALPPDAQIQASVLPFSYDPGIGNFSGARIALSTLPGSNISFRQASTNGVTPELEFADDVAEAQNQKYTNVQFGAGGRGPIRVDKHFYNGSFGLSRNLRDLPSLLNTSPLALSSAGVARDSVQRLLGILAGAGVPTFVPGAPSAQQTDGVTVQANVDLTPGGSGTGHALTLGWIGNFSRSQQVTGGQNALLTMPSHNGESQRWANSVSARHTNYFWFGILSNSALGYSRSGVDNAPYLRVPNGNVRVGSLLEDGSAAVRTLSFGGHPGLDLTQRNQTAELTNELRWYAGNNRHAVKLTSSIRHESFTSDQSNNLFGTFTYNSLAELEAEQPSSFSRTLFAPLRRGSQVTAAASLGDYWRPTSNVQVQYGVRVDGNRFLTRPERNASIEALLGQRNDRVPNRVYLSPRLGFTWIYGTQNQIAFVPGAARPPRALIQGGIGVFQNLRASDLIAGAVNNTGLPGSSRQVLCVGAATPAVDWSSFSATDASIPTSCADGSDGTVFSNGAPNISFFSPDFRQTRAWRSNLNWGGPILDNRFALGISAVYSLNLHQPDAVDRNLIGIQRFALDDENGRPVYVHASGIDDRTGVVALRDSRVATDFSRVVETRSDLRSTAKQLLLSLRPVTANPRLRWSLSYQWLDLRDQYRGFSSTTGSPFGTAWGRSLQPGRHQIGFGFSDFPLFDVVYLSWTVAAVSGLPFTPLVAGDVNGDGAANNDRAFIFDPDHAADPQMSSEMRMLMSNGEPAARRCLRKQLGTLSTRGSCQAPWTAQAGINIRFNPQKIGLPKRTAVNLSINNPLGLADLLFHGQNIRGWGQNIAPDQNLMFVRGFNAATRRYTYELNQRFGSTRPTQSTSRVLPLINLRVQLDIGAPRERQVLTQQLNQGRSRPGVKMEAPLLKAVATNTIPNPMSLILQQPDSLRLTREQADSLAALSRAFTQFADGLWSPLARSLASLPNQYDPGKAYEQYVRAREETVDYLITLVPAVKGLLTKAQKRRLPLQLTNYLDERVLRFLRTSSSGDGGPFFVR